MVPQDQHDWVSAGAGLAVIAVKDEFVIAAYFSAQFQRLDLCTELLCEGGRFVVRFRGQECPRHTGKVTSHQAENEVPQPHDFVAWGFTKTNPCCISVSW